MRRKEGRNAKMQKKQQSETVGLRPPTSQGQKGRALKTAKDLELRRDKLNGQTRKA